MSDTTDASRRDGSGLDESGEHPTAGERCICGPFQPPHDADCPFSSQQVQIGDPSFRQGMTFGTARIVPDIAEPLPAVPATLDAGDVEALAKMLDRVNGRTLHEKARAVLASDWLAAVRREAERKALTEAADTWERLCTRGHPLDAEVADRIVPWLRDRAARIGS